MPEPDDLDIATRARRRDGAAFTELMRRQRRLIYAAIYNAVGPTDHADDIAQEVAAAAWRGIHRVRAPEAVVSWLWVIATRCAHRWRETSPAAATVPDIEHLGLLPGAPDHAGPVADRLSVAAALARLPEHERTVVLLHLVADLSYRDIAERTGWPMGTVQSRYARGIARLRGLLATEESTT